MGVAHGRHIALGSAQLIHNLQTHPSKRITDEVCCAKSLSSSMKALVILDTNLGD